MLAAERKRRLDDCKIKILGRGESFVRDSKEAIAKMIKALRERHFWILPVKL